MLIKALEVSIYKEKNFYKKNMFPNLKDQTFFRKRYQRQRDRNSEDCYLVMGTSFCNNALHLS